MTMFLGLKNEFFMINSIPQGYGEYYSFATTDLKHADM